MQITKDNKKIAAYHGDSDIIVNSLVKCQEYDVVLTGHNHIAHIKKVGDTLHINPGAVNGLRNAKKIKDVSVAIYDTKSEKAEIINL